LRLASRRST